MAKTYAVTGPLRVVNSVMTAMIRLGLAPAKDSLMTTRGRKSGVLRTTPVSLVIDADRRWLVAPYGAVGWVHNVRANGEATLRRGRRTERVQVEELDATAAAPVLRSYLRQVRVVRPYFDVAPDADLAAFEAEAPRHPVFAITATTPAT